MKTPRLPQAICYLTWRKISLTAKVNPPSCNSYFIYSGHEKQAHFSSFLYNWKFDVSFLDWTRPCFLDLWSLSLTISGLFPVSPHLSLIYTNDIRERSGFIDEVPAHTVFLGDLGRRNQKQCWLLEQIQAFKILHKCLRGKKNIYIFIYPRISWRSLILVLRASTSSGLRCYYSSARGFCQNKSFGSMHRY